MEQDLPALKPQWLMQGQVTTTGATNLWTVASPRPDNQGRGGSSRNHSSGHNRDQNSRTSSSRVSGSNGPRRHDRDGMGKSRGYASFGRNREREREKDFDSCDRESRSVTADRDGFESFSTCRPERDRLNRSRSKTDTWSKGEVSSNNCNTSRSNTGGVSFERDFPQLSFEDKNARQDISRVPSPGITSPIQRIPPITAPDRWNSVLADVPVSSEPKKNLVALSVSRPAPSKQSVAAPNSGTSLSMAETVMQVPLRISVGPQLSTEAQKIEEITLRQNTLRPMMSPAIKSSVTGSSKTKGARNGDPSGPSKATHQSLIPSANGSARAPVKTDLSKLSQPGSLKILTREQKCTTHTAKDCPDNPMSPPAPVTSVEPLKKPCVSQKSKVATHDLPLSLLQGAYVDKKLNARDKHRFFESLRTKSSNGSSSTVESGCPSPSSVADVKQDCCLNLGNDISLYHSGMKCTGNGKCSCEEANSSDGSQRHLSDNEENNSSLEHTADGFSQNLLLESRSDSSSEPVDRGDEFRVFLSNNTEGSFSSAPADSDDGYKRSHSGSEEASSSSEATEPGDEEHPAEDSLPADFVAFMTSLGWEKDKKVEPLGLEEIAVTVRANEELEQKLLSMEDNANIKIVLLYIYSGRGLDKELQKPNAGAKDNV
ncbi:hypothetical protein E2562_008642 [Oryza meyeriana var. granulata]|uniref:Uncharacterized protein n=1 Tax=Oryza meyeriana var. granulata TaxID=110450 RepID=A0A6G1F5J5_9ORYZ|nr:hypothetical protein E2562_008642 [Oryza meyeriana var. granulata]